MQESFKFMRYSIVMLTKDRRWILPLSIQSVLNQTYEDFEFIIIDDGEDPVEDLVKSYNDDRIQYYYEENFDFLGEKFNYGCKKANGDWLCILGDDDCTSPYRLEALDHLLKYNDRLKYVNTSHFVFNNIVTGKFMRWHIVDFRNICKAGSHGNIESKFFWSVGGFPDKRQRKVDQGLQQKIRLKHGSDTYLMGDLKWIKPDIGDTFIQTCIPKVEGIKEKNIWQRHFEDYEFKDGIYLQTPMKEDPKDIYKGLVDIYNKCREKFLKKYNAVLKKAGLIHDENEQ